MQEHKVKKRRNQSIAHNVVYVVCWCSFHNYVVNTRHYRFTNMCNKKNEKFIFNNYEHRVHKSFPKEGNRKHLNSAIFEL